MRSISQMPDLQAEATEVLQRIVRFNTVNPPGAERACNEYLEGLLAGAGFETTLVGEFNDRPNLVARLAGRQPGPVLGLLGHTDTVLATPADWKRDPWSGDVVDGVLWGRGSLDMKSQVAAEVAAAVSLARDGWRPERGDLLVMCVVDEETGGAHGAQYLTEEHPDLVRCDYLLNEGGGDTFEWDGVRRYGLGCGEKGVFRFTISTEGSAGHASLPDVADNALLKLAPLIAKLGERQPPPDLVDEPRALLAALGLEPDRDPEAAIARLRERAPDLAPLIEPMCGVTFAPTKVRRLGEDQRDPRPCARAGRLPRAAGPR